MDTVKKAKKRIQALLCRFVRAKYGLCLLRRYSECAGVLQADHIVGRTASRTYWLPENVVCLCWSHHFYWKKSNPGYWADEVKTLITMAAWNMIHNLGRILRTYRLADWQAREVWLKDVVIRTENGEAVETNYGENIEPL